MAARIGPIGFQQLPLVRRADCFSIDEKRARPLVRFFSGVGRQAQIGQRPLQKAIQGGRLSLADGGAQRAGKNRRGGREVQIGINRGLILSVLLGL